MDCAWAKRLVGTRGPSLMPISERVWLLSTANFSPLNVASSNCGGRSCSTQGGVPLQSSRVRATSRLRTVSTLTRALFTRNALRIAVGEGVAGGTVLATPSWVT